MRRNKQILKEKLASIHLEAPEEQNIITNAIQQLENIKNEHIVLSTMCDQFRKLALNKKISPKGLKLFSELQKPNAMKDTTMYFPVWL